jgi:hypothetical protein
MTIPRQGSAHLAPRRELRAAANPVREFATVTGSSAPVSAIQKHTRRSIARKSCLEYP